VWRRKRCGRPGSIELIAVSIALRFSCLATAG
jgi:hypothetical protein